MQRLDLDMARKALDSQPFSRLVGARITSFGDGRAVLEVDIREELRQQNGFLHGESSPTPPTTPSPSRPGRHSARPS